MTADELGDWRRTHYSAQVGPSLDGKEVTVFGWVSAIRNQTGVIFVMLTDRDGSVQVTLQKPKASKALLQKMESLTEHSSIGVRGLVKSMPKAPGGAEIVPADVRLVGVATKVPPFGMFGGSLPSIDKRLDERAVDLRREKSQALFRIWRTALRSARDFLESDGFLEVRTPKLISTATEGGASLFSVLYYNRPAFLTQSPQLYKEELVMPFEKVFEIGPAFRAEESRTQRHLSEITSIDIEEAFVDYGDVMDTLEALVRHVRDAAAADCARDYEAIGKKPPPAGGAFPRRRYDDVVRDIKKMGGEVAPGGDITAQDLEKLGGEYSRFYFIIDWPTSSKPFYIKPSVSKPRVSESFDLMHGPLELSSGGSRISSKSQLVKRLKEQKLKPQSFEYHLKPFDYGMPPHAGFGLGLERLMMVLTGEENIRDVTLFPRDKLRLTP